MWLSRLLIALIVFAPCFSAEAQQPTKIPRIGYLSATSLSTTAARVEAFRRGLNELGYTEGKDILIQYRYAEGKLDRVRELALELVRLNVDVIVSGGPAATGPAKEATTRIPIVMGQDTDPVGNGFVASLARPGGNITGLSTLAPELSGKQLELLKEIVPKLARVVFIGMSTEPGNAQALREIELAARAYGIKLQNIDIRDSKDIENGLREASQGRAGAVLVPQLPILASQRKQITELAVKRRLPAVYGQAEYVDIGGLIYYGPSITELFRRAATYVDKILKGAKPSDLPVEQPTKFEFVVNLKTAKQIGLTIPPNVLARADRVIKESAGINR